MVQGRKIIIRSTIKKKFLSDGKKILNSYLSSERSSLVNSSFFISLHLYILFYIKKINKLKEKKFNFIILMGEDWKNLSENESRKKHGHSLKRLS